jgi:cell division septum initiation protein DivIVA
MKSSEKKMTVREIAEQLGCSVDTIQRHANKLFGSADNGVTRYFNDVQATMIVERVKSVNNNQYMTSARAAEVSTPYSAALKAKELSTSLHSTNEKAQAALVLFADAMSALQSENETLKGKVENLSGQLQVRNEELISAGLALSDREDIAALYGRWK